MQRLVEPVRMARNVCSGPQAATVLLIRCQRCRPGSLVADTWTCSCATAALVELAGRGSFLQQSPRMADVPFIACGHVQCDEFASSSFGQIDCHAACQQAFSSVCVGEYTILKIRPPLLSQSSSV